MPEFKSWQSYYDFEQATKHRTRYIYAPEVREFLDTLLATCRNRIETIPEASPLWRAQIGNEWEPFYQDDEYIGDFPAPHKPERMKPLTDRAVEGRVNPKGIPYLYLATHRDTALAEVRPWIGSLVSVAQFKTLRVLEVINCTTDQQGHFICLGEPPPNKREELVWRDIDRAFAKPVNRGDDSADYIPTQIIAELFKSEGFDGVAYRSSLGSGHNIVLFDLEAAELINSFLFEAKSISFEFEEVVSPYAVARFTGNESEKEGV